jgi:uncharacterized protein YkwD
VKLALIVVLTACGRVGFDPGAIGDGGHHGSDSGGNEMVTPAVCGDGICEGAAGESCASCATDCKSQTPVCGNAACDPGEDGTSCYVDCGPVPWTWSADETDLLAAINSARTSGFPCNGTTVPPTNALTLDADLQAAARDLAWEEAQFGTVGQRRCDGESIGTFLTMANASSQRLGDGQTTTTDRMNVWIGDPAACSQLGGMFTVAGVAVAVATNNTYVVLMR